MFDINKLDEEARRFYYGLPQIARDALRKSGGRFASLRDLQDYYRDYIDGYDSVLYQNTPDQNSNELDPADSYATDEGALEFFDLAGAGEDETDHIKENV